MKRFCIAAILLAVMAALCGCRKPSPSVGLTTPAASPKPPLTAVSSYPPDKTASQDTAGAETKLPEAATAAATVDGTLAP